MSDFDDLGLDRLVPKGTVRFTLSRVFVRSDQPLVLVMRHAGDSNKAYKSARAKVVRELAASSKRSDAAAVMKILIPLYAATVVEGWENARAKDGTPLPYKPDTAIDLFSYVAANVPDDLDAAFSFAANPDNYRDAGGPANVAEQGEALGK